MIKKQSTKKTIDDDIQTRIGIIDAAIRMYSEEVDRLGGSNDNYAKHLRGTYLQKVLDEKQELEKLKAQYPEYFL